MNQNQTYQLIPHSHSSEEFTVSECTKIGDLQDISYHFDRHHTLFATRIRDKVIDGVPFYVVYMQTHFGYQGENYLLSVGLLDEYKKKINFVPVENS